MLVIGFESSGMMEKYVVNTDGTMSKLDDQSNIQSKREDRSKIQSKREENQSKTKKRVTYNRTAPPGFHIRWSKLS